MTDLERIKKNRKEIQFELELWDLVRKHKISYRSLLSVFGGILSFIGNRVKKI